MGCIADAQLQYRYFFFGGGGGLGGGAGLGACGGGGLDVSKYDRREGLGALLLTGESVRIFVFGRRGLPCDSPTS